jgi:putative addiction module killer protein
MLQIERTAQFDTWLRSLKDNIGKRRIQARLDMLALGHWGNCKPVGEGVTELRLHTGPGYRVYCWQDGAVVVVILCAGDKATQTRDIGQAQAMVQLLKVPDKPDHSKEST